MLGNSQCILHNNRKFSSKNGKKSEFSVLDLSHLLDQNILRLQEAHSGAIVTTLICYGTCWRAGSSPRTVCIPPSAVVAKLPTDTKRK